MKLKPFQIHFHLNEHPSLNKTHKCYVLHLSVDNVGVVSTFATSIHPLYSIIKDYGLLSDEDKILYAQRCFESGEVLLNVRLSDEDSEE